MSTARAPTRHGVTLRYESAKYAMANRWDARHLDTIRYTLAPQPGQRLLEVGSGRGHLVKRLADDGVDIVGVDANPHAVSHAVTDRLRHMPAERLDFADDSFDLVASFHMIEHVEDLEATLGEMARVLRPGGRLLLVYPAEPVRGLYAIPTSFIFAGHPFKARQIHRHTVRPRHLRTQLARHHLKEVGSRFRLLSSPQFETVAALPARDAPGWSANGQVRTA